MKKPGKEKKSFAPPMSQAPESTSGWLKDCFSARYVRRIEANAKTVVADAKKEADVVNELDVVFAVSVVVETASVDRGSGGHRLALRRTTL